MHDSLDKYHYLRCELQIAVDITLKRTNYYISNKKKRNKLLNNKN